MSKQVNVSMYDVFKYDFMFINNFEKPILLQLRNINCRNKKDITTFINSSSCVKLEDLSKFLIKYNLDVLITKRYVNFWCGIIDTKSTIARHNTINIPKIKFDMRESENNNFSDLD